MKKTLLASFVAMLPVSLAFTANLAYAQSPSPADTPSDIEVRAPRSSAVLGATQPDVETAKQMFKRVPGGASITPLESFNDGRVATLADALGMTPGVFIQPRFGAEEARLSIRGSGIQRTFHGRGIKLMQDGIPINLADGGFDFQANEALATQYIEVLRGANAFGYGAANLGGVINYVSKTGLSNPGVGTRFELGSFGYSRAQAEMGAQSATVDGYATITHYGSDGFRDRAEQSSQKGLANFGWRPTNGVETRFFFASIRSNSDLPGSLTRAQLDQNPRQANPANVLRDNKRDLNIDRISNRTVIQLPRGQLDLSGYYSTKELFHPIGIWLEQENRDWGASARYSVAYQLAGLASTFKAGVNPYKGITDQDTFARPAVGLVRGNLTDRQRQTADGYDVFVENTLQVKERLGLITGLQYAKTTRKVDDLFPDQTQTAYSRSFDRVSPRFGLLYDLQPGVQVYSNLSGSFEPPSFAELGATGVVNRNVAQRAQTLELGTRGDLQNLSWDASLYFARIRDQLIQLQTPSGGSAVTTNVDKSYHAGLELGTRWRFAPQWQWSQNLLVNHFRFDGDQVFGDRRIAGIPPLQYRTILQKQLTAQLRVAGSVEMASRAPVDHMNTLYAPGYAIAGLRLAGALPQKGGEWFVDARNLFDKRYAATTGVSANANLLSGQQLALFLPGDGRSFFTGVQLKW